MESLFITSYPKICRARKWGPNWLTLPISIGRDNTSMVTRRSAGKFTSAGGAKAQPCNFKPMFLKERSVHHQKIQFPRIKTSTDPQPRESDLRHVGAGGGSSHGQTTTYIGSPLASCQPSRISSWSWALRWATISSGRWAIIKAGKEPLIPYLQKRGTQPFLASVKVAPWAKTFGANRNSSRNQLIQG